MTAADRRRVILEALSTDKFTTRANLAFEFGVSKRTIDHDLLLLSRKYLIYAIPGKGGGDLLYSRRHDAGQDAGYGGLQFPYAPQADNAPKYLL